MLTYLALGDSYTIGEQVPLEENFPHQFVALLRKKGIEINDPIIVAKTGWTTDELQDGIAKAVVNPPYDIVTLLIGVNNQYRGRSLADYEKQFAELSRQAIEFAGGNTRQVAVLSIPDWGVTPYAAGRDRDKIAREIDQFNQSAENICRLAGVQFISITEGTREATRDPSLLTADELHPSGKDYARWAVKLAKWWQTIGK